MKRRNNSKGHRTIGAAEIQAFKDHLCQEERAVGTVEKYVRDVRTFSVFAEIRRMELFDKGTPERTDREPSFMKETLTAWKASLLDKGYAPVTINSMLAAVHSFFAFMEWDGCGVKYLKVQRRLFRDPGKELTRQDYEQLVGTASKCGRKRLALLIETICATGIRVSEVKFITVEAAQKRRAEVALKGKIRTILIPNKLVHKLLKYAGKQKIASGEIFLTKSGVSLSRRQIWAEMKQLCKYTGIDPAKVFPHNLRHLFARVFYKSCRDIVRLADVLGHSSIETTRIYLVTTVAEYAYHMDKMGLVT